MPLALPDWLKGKTEAVSEDSSLDMGNGEAREDNPEAEEQGE